MAFALVGSAGVATQGAADASVTPAWGAGASRTAGNLLLCFVSGTGSASLPATAGWTSTLAGSGTSCVAILFYKIATGGDAAPTISTGGVGQVLAVHLEEWSGNATTSFRDKTGSTGGTTSPLTATLVGADIAAGELLVMIGADFRSAARASNDTWTSNHGTPVLRASNNGVSSVNHYSHATLVTTSNSGADTATMTLSITTSITGLGVLALTFKLAPDPVSGTGSGVGTAATSTGTAAETMSGTGAGTGAAATASGSGTVGSAGATGTGAGTQAAQTATGTGAETFTGTGAGTPPPASSAGSGTSILAATGSGAGTQAAATATGSGTSLLAATGTGAGTGTAPSAAGSGDVAALGDITGTGAGVQVAQSAYGEGTVEGGVEIPPTIEGSTIFAPKLRVISGSGGGVQARQSAKGRGRVNDDDLVVLAA